MPEDLGDALIMTWFSQCKARFQGLQKYGAGKIIGLFTLRGANLPAFQ